MSSQPLLPQTGPPGFYISAVGRSSGKTLVSLGLTRAANRRTLAIQTFKKGPDYIDPLWLGRASARPCYNLDFWTQTREEILEMYLSCSADADLCVTEGTMGLHDGLSLDGSDSNAAAAKLLSQPVLLVIDCRGMHRTVAAQVQGLTQFDPQVSFAGVILNRVRSGRHETRIRQVLEHYTPHPVLGAIAETPAVGIKEQELGLVPVTEHQRADQLLDDMADLLEQSCDLDNLLTNYGPEAVSRRKRLRRDTCGRSAGVPGTRLRIGIAKDAAFHFYYQDDLQELERQGAELVPVSPLHDAFPEGLDGLLLGGGFPERHAPELAANRRFREGLRTAAGEGLIIRAECGGLMYLNRTLEVDGQRHPMAGVIPGSVTMRASPVGRGYVRLVSADGQQWPGHEFHHSTVMFEQDPQFVYQVQRGHGINGRHDGIRVGGCLATYTHFRHTRRTPWVSEFLDEVRNSTGWREAKTCSN